VSGLPQIPGYTVQDVIGAGGQGVVARGLDPQGRPVALKFLLDERASAGQRFRQEARVLRALQHPNLVRAYESGQVEGVSWLAMEQISGRSLFELVEAHGLPTTARIGALLGTLAHALDYCHAQGLVHRDLKPENVLIERGTGRCVLVDFGLVKRDPERMHLASLDEAGPLSLSGMIRGTPGYIAPEQVDPRQFGGVTPQTDVYALGGLLYYLLCGERPFRGKVPAVVMRKVLKRPAEDPRLIAPRASPALAALSLTCLAKDPAARPPGARAFALAVARAAGIPPVPAPPAPAPIGVEALGQEEVPEEPAPPVASAPPLGRFSPGQRFAGLEILRPLARGGAGAVYVARTAEGEEVALKILLGNQADDYARERFSRELQAGLALAHPGLVRVLDGGIEDWQAYIVLELIVGGRPIDAYAAEEGLGLQERVQLALQLTDAVQAAHEVGLIHRDLKPDNVLVTPEGVVRVIDFGLARHLDKERLTLSGQVLGTPHYMAPEQVYGRGAHADARTDVWAVGVILYELLAGERPFVGPTNLELMGAILDEAPPLVLDGDDVPRGLSEAVAMALAKKPEDRYPTMAAFGRDLSACVSGGSVDAEERAQLQRRGRGRRLALVALAVLVLAALGGAWAADRAQRLDPAEVAERVEGLSREAWSVLEVEAPLAEGLGEVEGLDAELEALAGRALGGSDLGSARDELSALRGLVHLARGERTQAAAISSSLVGERGACGDVLRAALSEGGEAAEKLGRVLAKGARRVELRRWRSRALASAGLESPAAAQFVLGDLERVEQLLGLEGEEHRFRARALLTLGHPERAAAAMVKATGVDARLRWELALARAVARFDAAPQSLPELFAELPPRPEGFDLSPLLGPLRKRLASLARRRVLDEAGTLRAALLVRVGLALGTRVKPEEQAAFVAGASTYLKPTAEDADIELLVALAEAAPSDLQLQRRVGLFGQRDATGAQKRRLHPALRRAIALSEGQDRRDLELAFLRERVEETSSDPSADSAGAECLSRADGLLEDSATPLSDEERGAVFAIRARVHQRRGKGELALAEIERALACQEAPSSLALRVGILRGLGRGSEGVEHALRFLRATEGASAAADVASVSVWESARASNPAQAREALTLNLRIRPKTGFFVRLALLELEAGEATAARASLEKARKQLVLERKRGVEDAAGAWDAVEGALAGEAPVLSALRQAVETLEELRGAGTCP